MKRFLTLLFAGTMLGNAVAQPDNYPDATQYDAYATSASNELMHRIALAKHRLLLGTEPTFTSDFILADIASTSTIGKRRFDEFHGDLSGRYLSAIVHSSFPQQTQQQPEGQKTQDNSIVPMDQLITEVIALQQPDGRFGRRLEFTPEKVGRDHMALLWGNGRMLVGLVDAAHQYSRQMDEITSSAVRLGDFLLRTIEVCSTPEMVERLKDQKANGYICFTQLTEGLAMLSEITKDNRYAEAAQKIYPWLPPRGHQHSHGYLSTLRGVMMIYDQLKNPDDLAFVEKHYHDLVSSSDYNPMGGVNEYFGSTADHKENLRDEGCSEADFLWLSLQLWQVTRKVEYLERAELAYYNALSFNQFDTGDFGHHSLNGKVGYRLGDQDHRAWWCCTMHGLRAMREVYDNIYRRETIPTNNSESNLPASRIARYFDLYMPCAEMAVMGFHQADNGTQLYHLAFGFLSSPETSTAEDSERTVYFRKPSWAGLTITNTENPDEIIPMEDAGDYYKVKRIWSKSDRLAVALNLKSRVRTLDGKFVALDEITTRTQGYLYHGPYLMGADSIAAPKYLAEPMGDNIVFAHTAKAAPLDSTLPIYRQGAHLLMNYRHDGFPGNDWVVRLRPVGDIAFGPRAAVRTLFTFEPPR